MGGFPCEEVEPMLKVGRCVPLPSFDDCRLAAAGPPLLLCPLRIAGLVTWRAASFPLRFIITGRLDSALPLCNVLDPPLLASASLITALSALGLAASDRVLSVGDVRSGDSCKKKPRLDAWSCASSGIRPGRGGDNRASDREGVIRAAEGKGGSRCVDADGSRWCALAWFRMGVAGGVGWGVGLTTTTRGAEPDSGGVEGRQTAGNVMYLCGSIICRGPEHGLSSGPVPAAGLGDRLGSIALFGSMSTMNLPTDGVGLRRPIEILRFELPVEEVNDARSGETTGGARRDVYEDAEANCWVDRSSDAARTESSAEPRGRENASRAHDRAAAGGARGHKTENPGPLPMVWVNSCPA